MRAFVLPEYSPPRQSESLDLGRHAPALDETQSSAPMPNSRLLSAERHVCPHTTDVRASQTS
jgi:hypothetical protein